jgi:hypothetical protein
VTEEGFLCLSEDRGTWFCRDVFLNGKKRPAHACIRIVFVGHRASPVPPVKFRPHGTEAGFPAFPAIQQNRFRFWDGVVHPGRQARGMRSLRHESPTVDRRGLLTKLVRVRMIWHRIVASPCRTVNHMPSMKRFSGRISGIRTNQKEILHAVSRKGGGNGNGTSYKRGTQNA